MSETTHIAPGIHHHDFAPEIAALLEDFPAALLIPVAWGEQDAFGHVNNIVYIRQFESARIEYMRQAGLWGNLKQADAAGAGEQIGPILASISCRYKLPVTFPDSVIAAARVKEIAADRMTMVHRTISVRHQRIAAEGEGVIVTYNYTQLAKTRVPDAMRAAIIAFEESRKS